MKFKNMKKVLALLFALTIGFGLNSCSSDDDGGVPAYTVVGKWKITSYTINGETFEDCVNKGIRQFKNDGVYLQDDYEIDPETEQCTESEDSPLIGEFTMSIDKLKTTVGSFEKIYSLEFINSNQFTLTDTYNNVDFVYTYTRQ